MTDSILTQARLKEILHYDPETGIFTRLQSQHKRFLGPAGSIREGYVVIKIGLVAYRAHRLAFLYMTGAFPPAEVDHINRDGTDNRWSNLRHADRALNNQNKALYRTNTSGFRGVSWHKKRQKWNVEFGGKQDVRHIGTFDTLLDAVAARLNAELKYGYRTEITIPT